MASLSRQLAQWVIRLRYDDLPPDVVDRAKGVTLHGLASVLLGSLTQREREVYDRIVRGMHNREIAVDLGISPRTVEVHRARVMAKLKARRLADLLRLRTPGSAPDREVRDVSR